MIHVPHNIINSKINGKLYITQKEQRLKIAVYNGAKSLNRTNISQHHLRITTAMKKSICHVSLIDRATMPKHKTPNKF